MTFAHKTFTHRQWATDLCPRSHTPTIVVYKIRRRSPGSNHLSLVGLKHQVLVVVVMTCFEKFRNMRERSVMFHENPLGS